MKSVSYCRLSGSVGRLFITASAVSALLCVGAFTARGERELLGEAGGIVAESIRVGPDGKRFAAVTVDPKTNQRRVVVNCRSLPRTYDLVAKGTPFFSPEGGRVAFVASRGGKCFVVVDGRESKGYEIAGDRWPIADVAFSPKGSHVAYKTRKGGKNFLVVDAKEFGPYDDAAADEDGQVRGIWDFGFVSEEYFSYRAKTGGGMVACRGRIRDGEITLTTSEKYEDIGSGSPVWLQGEAGKDGDLFAFVAREKGKDFLALLPAPPENKGKAPKLYEKIQPGSLICGANRSIGFTARDATNMWRAIICPGWASAPQGGSEWKPCDEIGELMHHGGQNRWACTARIGTNVVMLVNNSEGPAFNEIRHQETVFAWGDNRCVYVGVKDGQPRVVFEGKEGEAYREVNTDSIVFSPDGKLAYFAGDGKKRFVVLDGRKEPPFERVSDLRFDAAGKRFAYCAQEGLKTHIVIDGKPVGPYESVGPDSPVFGPDGLTAAWAAMGADGAWHVYVNGKAGPGFDAIVSQLTFAPGSSNAVYVARILAEGKYWFAMVSEAGVGEKYTSIWMGDGGKLFLRDNGRVEYFAKQEPLVYRETASMLPPKPPKK